MKSPVIRIAPGEPGVNRLAQDPLGDDAMHALVIEKPGSETVRFGPLTLAAAEEWCRRLVGMFHQTAHPEGTTAKVASFVRGAGRPGPYIHPHTVPGNVDDLMEPFRADQGYTDERFPDIHVQMVMRWGWDRASELWDQACRIAGDGEAADDTVAGLETTRASAAAVIAEATPLVQIGRA